jgi:hypothetical protein
MKPSSAACDAKNGEDDNSAMRKLTDSSVCYLQHGSGLYPCFDLATKMLADLLYARWAGVDDVYRGGKIDVTPKKITNFLKRMGFPDTAGLPLVDTKKACYEDREANIPVFRVEEMKNLAKEKGRRKPRPMKLYDEVDLLNICKQSDSDEEKIATLDNIMAICQCDRYFKQKLCRAPAYQRRQFGDPRTVESIDSPYVMPFDLHPLIALNHAYVQLGAYGMGILSGYPETFVEKEKELIRKMTILGVDKAWPLYRINWAFRDYNKPFKPLVDIAKARTYEEQLKILNEQLSGDVKYV